MNLCKNCKYHKEDCISYGDGGIYSYFKQSCYYLINKPHPVSGNPIDTPVECSAMRLGPCKLEGVLFESNKQD